MNTNLRSELRLLVIEDEALLSMDLESMLEELGHRVLGVGATVGQTFKLIERHAKETDAAVLDANLGGESSAPVAEALRSHGIPFIVASGYERDELERLGFNEKNVNKPYSPHELDDALQLLSGRYRPAI